LGDGTLGRVFVSYSARAGGPALRLLNALRDRLSRDHHVFVDRWSLVPGDRWRSVIYHELAECDAAVVLLGEAAADSRWVRRETDILLWRQALGAPIALIPVVLDGVSHGVLRHAGFGELLELQAARSWTEPVGDEDAERLADMLGAHLERALPTGAAADAMSEWASRISDLLADASDRSIRAGLQMLCIGEEELRNVEPGESRRRLFAHQLLASAADQPVYEAMGRFKTRLVDERHRDLIAEVIPTWVDAAAARHLLAASGAEQGSLVVLNGVLDQTARHYVARATCRAVTGYRYAVAAAVIGEDAEADLLAALEEGIRALLKVPPRWPLVDVQPRPGVSFLIVDPSEAERRTVGRVIAQIRERFPWVNVVLLTGAEPARSWHLGCTPVLLPSLGEGDELRAYQLVEDLRELLPHSMRSDVT
jgi:hypothetical protein